MDGWDEQQKNTLNIKTLALKPASTLQARYELASSIDKGHIVQIWARSFSEFRQNNLLIWPGSYNCLVIGLTMLPSRPTINGCPLCSCCRFVTGCTLYENMLMRKGNRHIENNDDYELYIMLMRRLFVCFFVVFHVSSSSNFSQFLLIFSTVPHYFF